MNILVLMAGKGERFLNDPGNEDRFKLPKPMIPVQGRTILEWTTRSLPLISHDGFGSDQRYNLTFAVRADHLTLYPMEQRLQEIYGKEIKIVPFDTITRGNLETAYIASEEFDLDQPFLILDSDNAYDHNELLDTFVRHTQEGPCSGVCYFELENPEAKWAFVLINKEGFVTELAEKCLELVERGGKPLVGTFYFSSTRLFRQIAAGIIDSGSMTGMPGREEFYMSQAIKFMVEKGQRVVGHQVLEVAPLGTPQDVRKFEGSNRCQISQEQKLDRTASLSESA